MKPACEIDEYASMRLTFRCTSAARLPIASDAHASTATTIVHRWASCGNATRNTRRIRISAVAFVAADMNAVTGVGAPSYTSGVRGWKGRVRGRADAGHGVHVRGDEGDGADSDHARVARGV